MTQDQYTVSHYLFDRLKEMGVAHLFGVPGDYAFPALAVMENDPELTWVGECNELNAAVAANGYARFAGIGASIFTCGPGEIGALAGIGAAFSEQVPVVVIVGHPSLEVPPGNRQTHHGLHGDFSGFMRVFAEFTVAQTDLAGDDPGAEIDRVLAACWEQRRPVYIQFPHDVQSHPVARPASRLELPSAGSDATQLAPFVEELRARIERAERPAMLLNYPVGRFGLTPLAQQFAAATGIPFATLFAASSAFVDHAAPEYMGVYLGRAPGQPVSDRIEAADLLIRLATEPDETIRGLADPSRTPPHVVDLWIDRASIAGRPPAAVAMADVLRELTDGATRRSIQRPDPAPRATFTPRPHTDVSEQVLLESVSAFLEPGDVFVVDVGTCSPAALYPAPAEVKIASQFSWAGIGYSIPMLLGSQVAQPDKRHVVLVGDGALQLTAQELSTILRHDFAPIIVVLDNARYLIENVSGLPSQEDNDYNVLQAWDYPRMPAVLHPGDDSFTVRVHTEEQLADALHGAAAAHREGRASLIDVVLSPTDVNESLITINHTIAAG